MGKRRRGKKKRVNFQSQAEAEEELYKKTPHTFVFARGDVGKYMRQVVRDIRHVMEPYTASKLKVRKTNVLKDFVSVAGPMNITNFLIATKTSLGPHLRIARLPRGPTLSFEMPQYTLTRDVLSSQRKSHGAEQKQFQSPPFLMMYGFEGEHIDSKDQQMLKLVTTVFQNMFPTFSVQKTKLDEVRRCVLLNYNPEDKTIDFRHYNVKAVPVGTSRGVKKLTKSKIPDLSKFQDMSEYLLKGGGYLSESEGEFDDDSSTVTLPQAVAGRGNVKSAQSAIRLSEIGPRLTLSVLKVTEGMCDGEVLYHKYVNKTKKELEELKALRKQKRDTKAELRRKQEENVAKKKKLKEEHKAKSLAGIKRKQELEKDKGDDAGDEDDDAEYYRQEVGEEPDADMFSDRPNKKARLDTAPKFQKKKNLKTKSGAGEANEENSKRINLRQMSDHEKMIYRRKQKKLKKEQKKRPRGMRKVSSKAAKVTQRGGKAKPRLNKTPTGGGRGKARAK